MVGSREVLLLHIPCRTGVTGRFCERALLRPALGKPPIGQATPPTRADAVGNPASWRSWRRMKSLS